MEESNPFRKPKAHEEVSEAWLMSYADMITLLLAFFVVFVSTSEPKEDQLAAATRGMQARFGTVDLSTPFQGAFRAIQGIIDDNRAHQAISVEKTERGLQMELSTSIYFKPDTAQLDEENEPMLAQLIDALNTERYKKYNIIIEGHTDDVKVSKNSFYSTNWELSAARATRLVRYFIEQGYEPERMQANAYGGSHPKLPNLDEKGYPIESNRERNRRMVIRMERSW